LTHTKAVCYSQYDMLLVSGDLLPCFVLNAWGWGVIFMDKLPIRVVIADSHDLFRQGLSSLLSRQPEIEIVGEAKDGNDVELMVQALNPDVLLMEIYMKGVDGLPAVLQIMADYPNTNVAILTSSEDDNDVLSAVKMGVKGYILKNSSLDELVQSIQALSQGGAYFSSSMFTKVLQEFTHLARRRDLQEAKGIDALTDREKDVLRLVARGATNRDIANELVITENTVKVHLRNILDKLQLRNRQQAAAYAVQEGLVARVMPGSGAYNGYGMRGGSNNGLRVVPSADDVRAARSRLADYKLNLS
jgi:DNA-binding NarL/FixJ family response regulator